MTRKKVWRTEYETGQGLELTLDEGYMGLEIMRLDKREREVLIEGMSTYSTSCTTTILETPVFYTPKNFPTACPSVFVHAFFSSQCAYRRSDWRFPGLHSQICT